MVTIDITAPRTDALAAQRHLQSRLESVTIRPMPGLFDGTPLERPVTCELCEQPLDQCRCPRNAAGQVLLPKDQPARVSREKRRKGKIVTVISGLDPAASDLPGMLRALKTACGAGGTVADNRIELQGDHREHVLAYLREQGYPAKPAGG